MWNEPCVTNSKIYTCTKIQNFCLKVYNFHYRRKIPCPSIWQLIDHQKNSLAFCTNIMGWIRCYHSQIILLFLKDSSMKTQVGYIVIYESEVHICVCVCVDACVWMYEGFVLEGGVHVGGVGVLIASSQRTSFGLSGKQHDVGQCNILPLGSCLILQFNKL